MKNDIKKQNAVVPAVAGGLCYEPWATAFLFLQKGG